MSRILLEHQPDGISEYLHWDESEGRFAIERVGDVEPVIEANKRAQNDGDGYSPSREMRKVASVPAEIWAHWMHLYGPMFHKDKALLRRLLNDPDNRNLRVSLGGF